MSSHPVQPSPIVQMGHVEKIAEVAQNQPHVQQRVTQEHTREELRQEHEKVPVTNASGKAEQIKVHDKPAGQRRKQRHRKRKMAAQAEQEESSAATSSTLPAGQNSSETWAGIIIDVKV